MSDEELELQESESGSLVVGGDGEWAGFEVDFEVDDDWKATLLLTCPACAQVSRIAFVEVKAGEVRGCPCAKFTFEFTGEDLVETQAALDGILDEFRHMGELLRGGS